MTKSNTNKSAPARALLSATSIALAAVVALEVTGLQALSQGHHRWATAAAADGDTIYTAVDGAPASDTRVVAQAAN
ncbi:MAG TPA: hypothetical protein VIP05_34095 [Burkholderiaceae bacterium]